MRCVRALPIFQLMPAVGSRRSLSPPRCWVDFPERLSGRTPFPARTSGTPSIIMSPDHCPWTQIRLGAGTPNARLLHRHVLTRRQRDDLNHNVFTSSARPPGSVRRILARLKVVRPRCAAGAPP